MVRVDLDNVHIVVRGILADDIQLVFWRILLMFGRHTARTEPPGKA
jgi:hypothetical protein